MKRRLEVLGLTCILGIAACGGSDDSTADPSTSTEPSTVQPVTASEASGAEAIRDRIEEIQAAVATWAEATSIDEAHAAAETAINLVAGSNGPTPGDLDGDGTVQGQSDVGLLSGPDDGPAGLATELDTNTCVQRDVLGSTADDPAAGWDETEAAIAAWRPDNNTMPTLLSHPMRIIGWATFTLDSDDLDTAHEYAGHAQLHVDVSRNALDCSE